MTLAVLKKYKASPRKRRRKAGQSEQTHREGHTAKARLVKTLQNDGDVKNGTADM
jgi:hypothetical protein